MSDPWVAVPLRVETDLRHGGRWTSLRTDRREWLWTNADPMVTAARRRVVPGDAFVDAGGAEECAPTIRGVPDHGDAWSRDWRGDGSVDLPAVGRLRRAMRTTGEGVDVSYVLSGAPGTPFVHAVHALLDLGQGALLEAEPASMMVLDSEPEERPWPSGLDRLGPDDGTATCVVLKGCREASVVDGDDALTFSWTAPGHEDLCSLVLWRNLCGWPEPSPYRSIGIEPLVGRTAELSGADPADVARMGPDGTFRWTLHVSVRERRSR